MKKFLLLGLLLSFGPSTPPLESNPYFTNITCFFPKPGQAFTAYVEINSNNKDVRFQLIVSDSKYETIIDHFEFFTGKGTFGFQVNLPAIVRADNYYDFSAYILKDIDGIAAYRSFRIMPQPTYVQSFSGTNSVSGINYGYYINNYIKDEFYIKTNSESSNLLDIDAIEIINTSSYFSLPKMPETALFIDVKLPNFAYSSSYGTRFYLNAKFKNTNTLSFDLKNLFLVNESGQLYEAGTASEKNKLFLPESLYGTTLKCTLQLYSYGYNQSLYYLTFFININKKIIGNCSQSEYCVKKSNNNNDYNFVDEFRYEVGA